ncbi:MAG: TIGR03435 family protein [Bryobacterales bacterium]|nr:TIGR03435 family protein [Bryobacterales bacterium]
MDWSSLLDKVVVLDFWATWCAPCVASVPHMNGLAEQFRGKPVVFVTITDDDPETLDRFLKERPLKTWIVRDPERTNWKRFGVPSIPHLVVVNRAGRIVGETLPENLTAQKINALMEATDVLLPQKETRPSNLNWDEELVDWADGVRPETYAIIKPIKTATSGAWPRIEGNRLTADGVSLSTLVGLAYGVDAYHFDDRLKKGTTYRAAFRVPRERADQLRSLMQQMLERAFSFKIRWEDQERAVKRLIRLENAAQTKRSTAEPMSQMMRGKITLRRQPVRRLAELLSNAYGMPVIDDTSMAGEFDFDLPYQHGQPEVTTSALRAVGLDVADARRPLRILVLEPAEK